MTVLVACIFITGYLAIALEHPLKINKAASALLTGVVCWSVFALWGSDKEIVSETLAHHFSEIAGILFFLLGAMVIVELIDAHDGFEIITDRIRSASKKKLIWITGLITFFLSALLDNLTTTIVMVSLLRKMIPEQKDRLLFASLIVIAANAGGAWSPIGDVTTTMLWMGGQITSLNIVLKTFLASLTCFAVPAFLITLQTKDSLKQNEKREKFSSTSNQRKAVFITGIVSLLFVPVFKAITHLPPYMGIIFGLGLMWVITEMIHSGKDEGEKGILSVNHALRKIDTPSILFFLGILLAVSALQATGILNSVAASLDKLLGSFFQQSLTMCLWLLQHRACTAWNNFQQIIISGNFFLIVPVQAEVF
jgi:Na+/H+ antiporter NhaD/arsenite permease-like protein